MPTRGLNDPLRIPLSSAHPNHPQIELQLHRPVEVGREVRITVYDEWLFLKSNPRAHNKVFSTFNGYGAPIVPEPVREAHSDIGDGTNGILLSFLVAVTGEVPQKGDAKHRKWAFGPPQSVVTCRPKDVLVSIALGLRDEHNEIAYGPTIFLLRANVRHMRRLVMVVSDPNTHEIIYSNAWSTQRFIAYNPQGGPALVNAKEAEVALAVQVGGSGEGTGAPAPAGRRPPPEDITGKYEAFDSESHRMGEEIPALMVQINVAGNAIAAWWAPPPDQVTSHPHQAIRQPAVPTPLQGGQFGCALGHYDDDGYHLHWGPSSSSADPMPQRVGVAAVEPNAGAGIGRLEILRPGRLRLTLHKGDEHAVLFLSLAEPPPRWSNSTIEQVLARAAQSSPFIRRSILGYQRQPIPLAFWLKMQEDLVAGGRLGILIRQHESTTDPSTRRVLFTQIGNYLESLAGVAQHRDAVVAHFGLFANNIDLDISGTKQSVYDWLHAIAKNYLTERLERGMDAVDAVGQLPNGFKDVDIVPPHAYVYRAQFFSLGAEVGAGLKVGAYGFTVRLQRKLLKDGVEREPPPGDPWHQVTKKMYGGFVDLGGSLGRSLRMGASNMLAEVEFPTFHDIHPLDFNETSFYVISASTLTVSWASFSAGGASSAVMVMTVNSHGSSRRPAGSVRMVAGDKSVLSAGLNTQLIKAKPWGGSAALASFTVGKGWMTETEAEAVAPPTAETEPEQTLGKAQLAVDAYFRRSSATLEGSNLTALEESLAVERAIFVSGGGHARAAGHASPEGPDNDGLSQRRADNVIQVLRNAFDGRLAVSTEGIGYGHRAALNRGMIRREDIPAGPASDDMRKRYRAQEEREFPKYRVVKLWVNGVLLIEIKPGKVIVGG